jgi:glucose/arabinose dehydrogenase
VRPRALTLLALAPLLALAACGGSGPKPAAPSTPSAPAEAGAGSLAASAALAAGPSTSAAPESPGGIRLTNVAPGLEKPLAFAIRPGDTDPWIGLQGGQIVRIVGGKPTAPVLDVTKEILAGGERGLLGLVFSPDGSEAYVDVTTAPHGDTAVWAYPVRADGSFDTASRRTLLTQEQPYPNHNGGHLATGPDGMLYIGFGDGGSAGDPQRRGQDLGTWLGKILRIDPHPDATKGTPYTVPPDNPYVGTAKAKPEIWISGVRNPWRFSFDAANGDLWIGDVGQNLYEEIDHLVPAQARGANLGWSAFEASHRFNEDVPAPRKAIAPVHEYGRSEGCSVTGGVVYRGTKLTGLAGTYLFSDFCQGGVRGLKDGKRTVLRTSPPAVASFGVDADGEVWVLSLSAGVFRLDPS